MKPTHMDIKVLLVLSLGLLIGALNVGIVGPALPAIKTFFNVDERSIVWIISTYILFYMIGAIFTSKMSDKFGRKVIYILNMFIFGIGTLLVIFSSSFSIVLLGRIVQGFSAGGIFPISSAIIGDTFPLEKRGRALGVIGAFFALFFIIGPFLGGFILEFGWQWLFIIDLPIIISIITLSLFILPETEVRTMKSFDFKGMILLGTSLALFTFGINQLDINQPLYHIDSVTIWPLFLLSALMFLSLFKTEKNAKNPLIPIEIFKNRQIAITIIISLLSGLIEIGLIFIPSFTIISFNFSTPMASFMLIPVLLSIAIGSPIIGLSLDKFGSKKVIFTMGVFSAAGLLILSYFPNDMFLFIFASLIIGLGFAGFIGAPLRYIMLNEVSKSDRATGQALVNVSKSIGRLISSALFGAIIASTGGNISGYKLAYLFIGFISFLIVLLALGLKRKE